MEAETAVGVEWAATSDEFTMYGMSESCLGDVRDRLQNQQCGYSTYSLTDPPLFVHIYWFPSLPSEERRDRMLKDILQFVMLFNT